MNIDIKVTGVNELRAQLKDFSERRLQAAVATALTRTAVQVRDAVQQHATSAFDRPTPYTMRQLRYTAATAAKPVAAVGFNIAAIQDIRGNVVAYRDLGPGQTPAGKYLQFQVEGGLRGDKRFEKALRYVGVLPAGWTTAPGARAKIDAYGNQSPAELRQILSWFDAAEIVAGSRQNMRQAGRDKRRRGTRRTAGYEYVAILPGARGGLSPGIYRRTSFAMGKRIEPVLMFIKPASYKRRFDFYGVAEQAANRILPGEVQRAVSESAARLASRSAS